MVGKYVRPRDGADGDEGMTAPLKIAKGRKKKSGPFARIEDAIDAFRAGEIIIVCDDEDRENEGDLTLAAEKVTPKAINFMAKYGRGLICMPMTGERLDELEIPLMVNQNTARLGTAFCVTIEAKHSTSTGISAGDRADTVLAAIDPRTKPSDLARPGHMFPLRARIRRRAGARGADRSGGRSGADRRAVSRRRHLRNHERRRVDGARAGADEVREAAQAADDHDRRSDQVPHAQRVDGEGRWRKPSCPPSYGEFEIHAFENQLDKQTHMALVFGDIGDGNDIIVRVHSQCLTGDVLHSLRCDCGGQLDAAMRRIAEEGRGVLLYLNQEGRGIGLANKIRAYELQDQGFDTVEANEKLGFKADQRDYGIGVQILRELGVRSMRLLSNNPRKLVGVEGYGLSVSEWVPLEIPASDSTRRYLKTKKDKLGHKLSSV